MFFRQLEIDKTLTIDKIDLSDYSKELWDCISNAAEAKNVNALKHILEMVKSKGSDKISSEYVIDRIYFIAIVRSFSPDDMKKLFSVIPIDINRPIKYRYQVFCQPPKQCTTFLLNLAVAYNKADLVDFLLESSADVNSPSDKNETPEQELERRLAIDRQSSHPFDLPTEERMLERIKAAKQEVTCLTKF
jgi:hypothetical protein